MAHYKRTILFDNFNDNSINATKWASIGDGVLAETGGQLKVSCYEIDEIYAKSTQYCDLTKGIIAAKLYITGTATESMLHYFGFGIDFDYYCSFVGFKDYPDVGFSSYYLSFDSETVVQDEAVIGMSASWNDGDYIGVTADGNSVGSTIYLMKSSDGITWSNIWHGTLDYLDMDLTSVGLRFGLYNPEWEATNYAIALDDACYFAKTNAMSRVSNAFTTAIPKVRVGGAWVTPALKVRSGGAWVAL